MGRTISTTLNDTDGNPVVHIEIEIESPPEDCSCYKGGMYSLGTVQSIRAGDTDPECPHHGLA